MLFVCLTAAAHVIFNWHLTNVRTNYLTQKAKCQNWHEFALFCVPVLWLRYVEFSEFAQRENTDFYHRSKYI